MGALEIDPMGLITAAANGQKDQEELQVIVRTNAYGKLYTRDNPIDFKYKRKSQLNGEMDAKTDVALTFLRTVLRLSNYCEKIYHS